MSTTTDTKEQALAMEEMLFPTGPSAQDDVIYPLHLIDQIKTLQNMIEVSTWVYEDVLDAGKLHDALCQVFEIGDWRKLGGRIRSNSNGKLELHVPTRFTKERPAVGFSHESLNMRFCDHPLSVHIPRNTGGVSYHTKVDDFSPLSLSPGAPRTLAEYLAGDHPCFWAHVVSFEDATVVSLQWPHPVTDIGGVQAIVEAWSRAVAGDFSNIKPLGGVRQDLIRQASELEQAKKERYLLASLCLVGLRYLFLVICVIWDQLWSGSFENRTVCVPRTSVRAIRERMMHELALSTNGAEKPWISESDAMMSVFATSMARSQITQRPLTVNIPFDLRTRLGDTIDQSKSYVQNAVTMACATIKSPNLNSAAHNALLCRQTIVEQTKYEQVLAGLVKEREMADAGRGAGNFYGPANAHIFFTTNWNKSNLFHLPDFAPAVVFTSATKDESRKTKRGLPVFFTNIRSSPPPPIRVCRMTFYGIDQLGNYWISADFPKKTWNHIETALETSYI